MRVLDRLLAFDVSPQFSARVRRAVATPLGCLLLAAGVAAACGLAVHPRVFALCGGLLAVAAAGVCWPWVTARGVRASVRFDRPRAAEGDEVGAGVTVANHLPWPAWGLTVEDAVGVAVRVPAVGGRTETACRWVFVPPLRGVYPAAAPAVATGFPFGMWEARRPAAVAGRLVAWPRTFPVGPVPAPGGDAVSDGTVTRGKVGATGELLGVRPYRRGDSPRRIHWGQSAKHDKLIVCELQTSARPVVLLVLDADPLVHTPGADGSREWAVRVTASLAAGWLAAGALVGAAWADVLILPQAGREQVNRILDALAALPPAARPLADVLAAPAVRGVRAGVRVVVSTDARPPAAGPDRWVVLDRAGFGGRDAPAPVRRAWLDLPSAAAVPDRLRNGTAEARHGT